MKATAFIQGVSQQTVLQTLKFGQREGIHACAEHRSG